MKPLKENDVNKLFSSFELQIDEDDFLSDEVIENPGLYDKKLISVFDHLLSNDEAEQQVLFFNMQ